MSEMLLSYIVPVYNTAPCVTACLQSIVDQGLSADEYEVLVVDDGSTDGSKAVVEAFAREHPQVRLLCQANAGVSAARNRALDHARGRYVQFVDSDDCLVPAVVAPLLEQAVSESLDVLQFDYRSIDPDGNALDEGPLDSYPPADVASGVAFLHDHCLTPYVWRFLIRRDYLGECRFDTSLIVCEDGALIADFLLNARRVAYRNTLVYHYVKRPGSAMNNHDLEYMRRRIFSQIDSAVSIDGTVKRFEAVAGEEAPISVPGLRNVYLYFSMTRALTCGCVPETVERIRAAGLYPFPCVGPEANYVGRKWKVIHRLMMHPKRWAALSKLYTTIKR